MPCSEVRDCSSVLPPASSTWVCLGSSQPVSQPAYLWGSRLQSPTSCSPVDFCGGWWPAGLAASGVANHCLTPPCLWPLWRWCSADCEQRELEGPATKISWLSDWPRLFPGLPQLCCTSPSRVSSSPPQPSPWGLPLKPEPQPPAPTRCSGHANKCPTGEFWSALISVMNSLHFVFHALAATLPSEVPEDLSVPACKGVSQCVETSLSHLLPYIASLIPFPLSHFFLFSLALPHFMEISFPFLKPMVFLQHSIDVL